MGEFSLCTSGIHDLHEFEIDSLQNVSARIRNSLMSTKTVRGSVDTRNSLSSSDFMLFSKVVFAADYFHSFLKCWEPCVGPCEVQLFFENNLDRGMGVRVKSMSPILCTITSAFFVSINNILVAVDRNLRERKISNMPKGEEEEGMTADDAQSISTAGNTERNEEIQQERRLRDQKNIVRMSIDIGDKLDNRDLGEHEYHISAKVLAKNERVGFALKNFTGQSVRFIQNKSMKLDRPHVDVYYLGDGESGFLNFAASEKVIRNCEVVEEAFNVQRDITGSAYEDDRNSKTSSLHQISLQLCGFEWLQEVQTDNVGRKFYALKRIQFDEEECTPSPTNPEIQNALKLITEVVPKNGGRLIVVRSVFTFINFTGHAVSIFMSPTKVSKMNASEAILVQPGEKFHFPIALMTKSHHTHSGKALGYVWISPETIDTIKSEFESGTENGKLANANRLDVDFTQSPLDIYNDVVVNGQHQRDSANKLILRTCKISVKDNVKVNL